MRRLRRLLAGPIDAFADLVRGEARFPIPARRRGETPTLVVAHPEGFWLCTASIFDDFVVGLAYHCRSVEGTSSRRIYPSGSTIFAPYWEAREGRFCYPPHKLDFVYLGATLPAGQPVDARTEADKKADRFARRVA